MLHQRETLAKGPGRSHYHPSRGPSTHSAEIELDVSPRESRSMTLGPIPGSRYRKLVLPTHVTLGWPELMPLTSLLRFHDLFC
jgi:hypothetical protein